MLEMNPYHINNNKRTVLTLNSNRSVMTVSAVKVLHTDHVLATVVCCDGGYGEA